MKIKKEKEFHSMIKTQGVEGLYLLWGSDDYLIQRWKNVLLEPFGNDGFNLMKLDGQKLDLLELYDATQQLPLFASQKCVLVDDLLPKQLVAAEMKKLEQVCEDLPPETVLIFTCRGGGLDEKSALGKKLLKLIDTHGTVVELSTRDTAGLVQFLQSSAKEQGCTLSAPLAKELFRLCGNEMLILSNELHKVCSYAGSGELTQAHLEAVVIPKTEERVFDLGKAIIAGNAQRAMEIVTNLLYLRENPVAIIATLIMSYVDYYRAKIAQQAGMGVPEVVAKFSYKGREFRVRNAFQGRLTLSSLRKSLDLLAECDIKMKSIGVPPELLLEETVLALLAVREVG